MGFIRGQLPAFAQARAEMQAEEEKKPSPFQQLGNAFSGGLAEGLEKSMGEYFDRKRDTEAMSGASDLLKAVGKQNPDLEELLTKGREMGLHPDAIKLATQVTQAGQTLRGQREKQQGQQKMSEETKAAFDSYNDYMKVGNDMALLDKDLDYLSKMTNQYESHLGSAQSYFGALPGMGFAQSPEAKEYNAAASNVIARYKDIFKGRITDTDFNFIMNNIPQAHFTKAQNEAIIRAHKAIVQKYIARAKIAGQIRQTQGIRPDFKEQMLSAVEKYDDMADIAMKEVASMNATGGGSEGQTKTIDTPQGKFKVTPAQYENYMSKYGGGEGPGKKESKASTLGDPIVKVEIGGKQFGIPPDQVETLKKKYPDAKVLK